MLNKNLALIVLVMFTAGCGMELRSYVMTKPRVGLDQTSGNSGCVVGTCSPAPAPMETTRKVYVLEITRPVPESEVKKIEETAVNAITESAPGSPTAQTDTTGAPAAVDNTQAAAPAPVTVPVVGEMPGTEAASSAAPAQAQQNGGNMQSSGEQPTSYTVQKDDTLQKISKKVYGTYRHWYKIYKANKDKIQNPNVLQPGTVLTIPAIK